MAWRGCSVDFRGTKKIVMRDDLGIRGLLDTHEVVERNHLPGVGPQVILPNVFWLRAELTVGLQVDTVRTVIEIEIVHINRAHVDLQSVSDLAEGHLQTLRFFAVDADQVSLLEFPCAASLLAVSEMLCSELRTRSYNSNWNPPNCPSPNTAGGLNGTTIAPDTAEREPRKRAIVAAAEWTAPLRFSKGRRFA